MTDWPAWVQAVGSVGAIFVAIVIDQGEARRSRRALRMAAEGQLAAKMRLVEICGEGVARAIAAVEALDLTTAAVRTARPLQDVEIARYLANYDFVQGDGTPPLLGALHFRTLAAMRDLDARLVEIGPIRNETARTLALEALRSASATLLGLIENYQRGEW